MLKKMFAIKMAMVNVGEKAPDFALNDQHDNEVKLSDFNGRKVLLAFYVADWSPVCGPEMTCFKDDMNELCNLGINVIGISVDSTWSHKAWAQQLGIDFPILSDFSKDVSRAYGLLRPEGFSERAYLLIDEDGVVRWKHVMPKPAEKLNNSEILKAVNEIR